jgi:sec-independent protein translocase protein TatB
VFNVGIPEMMVLGLVALLVFGPNRLPKVAADAAKMIRQLRSMADNALSDVKNELGPEMADLDLNSLRQLHPRTFIRDALFDDDEKDDTPDTEPEPELALLGAGERPPYDLDAT